MKKQKHTPGKWKIDGQWIINSNDDPIAVCKIMNNAGQPGGANAHLIAAAPELLEACKVSEGYLQGLKSAQYATGGKFDGWDSRIMLLQSAIAKAEG